MRCGAIDVRVIERLKRICGQGHVVTDRDQLRTYESDGLRHYRSHPPVGAFVGSGGTLGIAHHLIRGAGSR